MAKNPPTGDGHRHGAVKERSQVYNPADEQLDETRHEQRSIHGSEGG